jgi:predicted nucleic acid-binding protein
VIVFDTSILSLALRRRSSAGELRAVSIFRKVVASNARALVPGIVFQEVLSGVRSRSQFLQLRSELENFPLLLAGPEHHLAAAAISNVCREHGVSAGAVDCLVAALTIAERSQLFTTDRDFARIADHSELRVLDLDALA